MILVDPAAIAIPNFATTMDEADELIDRLLHIAKICSTNTAIRVLVNDDIEGQLGEYFGNVETIKQYLIRMKLDSFYDPRDLATEIAALQHRATRFGDWEHTLEVQADEFSLSPDLDSGAWPPMLLEATRENLLLVSVARNLGHNLVLTSPFSQPHAIKYEVNGRGLIINEPKNIQELESHSGLAVAISRLGCLIDTETAIDLWRKSSDSKDLTVAISIGALAKLKECGQLSAKLPIRFSIGDEFYKSLSANQACGDGKFSSDAAETCFALVADVFAGHDAIFGAKTAEIRNRDDAEGRRVHLTKDAIGLRLMYWRLKEGIEFANVGPKKELYISRGNEENICYCSVEKLYTAFLEL